MKKSTSKTLRPLSVLLCLGATAPTTVLALDPFTCEDTVYQAISGEIRSLDLSTGNYGLDIIQPINNNPDPFSNINAAGYNTTDDFIYGIVQGSNDEIIQGHLIRVGSLGLVEDLGLARTGITGDIYNDTLFFAQLSRKLFYVENISSLVENPSATLTYQTVTAQTGYPNIPNDLVTLLIDGSMYLFGVRNQTLFRINITDINNIIFETETLTGVPTTSNYGAMWSDVNGILYAGNNNGDIHVGADGTFDCVDSTPTFTPGIVSWCVCEQCEIS